jgi:NAD(P)-dependent dehydrogenase (short-subunit alcohol dehydrogenase family)
VAESGVAIIVGAGPGLGTALARRFAGAGMAVAVARRDRAALDATVSRIGPAARAYACDAADEGAVSQLFEAVARDLGPPRLVVHNAGGFVRKSLLDTSAAEFEQGWRSACLGGFLVGRAAVRSMLAQGENERHRGTIIFTGATAALRGGAGFQNMAIAKFGLRALAQSMAREFQPRGIHVAHVVIDGQIESDRPGRNVVDRGIDAVLSPDAIAETYYQLHLQPPSAWTQEVDLRPYVEKF